MLYVIEFRCSAGHEWENPAAHLTMVSSADVYHTSLECANTKIQWMRRYYPGYQFRTVEYVKKENS